MKPPTKEEALALAIQGQSYYETNLRVSVETQENTGKILVLDVDSGDYVIDSDHLTALRQMQNRHPDSRRFSLRIGYPALAKMGGGWQSQPVSAPYPSP
jgi:hypothetical protein